MTDGMDNTSIPVERISGVKSPRASLDARIVLENGAVFESDIVRLQSFTGQESISNLFEFKLDLRANDYTFYDSSPAWQDIDSTDPQASYLDFDQLLGASITVMIGRPASELQLFVGSDSDSQTKTYFNGMIQNVSLLDRGVWNITMVPRLSLLKLQSSYRVFSDKTILEVISAVLDENNIIHTVHKLLDNGELDMDYTTSVVTGLGIYRRQDWLQAGETDFDFLTRLLSKAGLLYYFVHALDRHIMVLTDTNYYQSLWRYQDNSLAADALEAFKSSEAAIAKAEKAFGMFGRFRKKSSLVRSLQHKSTLSARLKPTKSLRKLYLTSATLGQDLEDSISQFHFQRSLAVRGVSTILARKESSWETQNPAITAPVYKDDRLAAPQSAFVSASLWGPPGSRPLNMEKLSVVSFGASEYELDIRKQLLEKKLLSARTSLSGTSNCASLQSGYIFQLMESRPVTSSSDGHSLQGNSGEAFRPEVANVNRGAGANGNVGPEPRKMVAVSVSHNATIDGKYSNEFTALDASGFGLPFEASGDTEGTVIAQVCSVNGDANASTAYNRPGVSSTTNSGSSGGLYLAKGAFSERSQKTFVASAQGVDSPYVAQGLYVKLVTQDHSSAPLWVRLSDSMTTIPELGAFVLVGRARDETELPEIQQILDANGTRNVLPAEYNKSTSWGDTYSMSYGDSHRISVPMIPNTSFETSTAIVNYQTQQGRYSDVSFSESSAFSYNVSRRSQSISVNGESSLEDLNGIVTQNPSDGSAGPQDYVQISKSTTFGDTYSATELNGQAYNYSVSNGNQHTESTTTGDTHNSTVLNGKTYNYSVSNGYQHSESTTSGGSYSATTQSGLQESVTTINGDSNSTTTQTGNAYTNSTNARTENVSKVDTSISTSTIGASKSTTTTDTSNNINITGASANTNITGASVSTNVTGAAANINVNGIMSSIDVTGISTKVSVIGLEHTGISVEGTNVIIKLPFLQWQNTSLTPKLDAINSEIRLVGGIEIVI